MGVSMSDRAARVQQAVEDTTESDPEGLGSGAAAGDPPRDAGLTLDDLPPPDIQRWVVRRKAIVVEAVEVGLLSLEAACERYNLSVEEFRSWQRKLARHGLAGLRTTRLQQYRSHEATGGARGATM